jgi:spermidine/putrescine transport system permease protein
MKRFFKASYLTLVYLFLYVPVLILIVFSFNDSRYSTVWKGFSLQWYSHLFNNSLLMEAFVHSITIALISSVLSCILGTLAAVVFYWYRFIGRKVLHTLIFCVMMSPDIVMGISLLSFFILIGMQPGFLTLLLAHITFSFPFVVTIVFARLQGFDHSIIDAARDLGAGEFRIFTHVIFPLILPAVMAGWLVSFTLSLDDVIVSFFVTGPNYDILPLKIYSMVRLGVKPEVNALSTLLFAFTLVSVFCSHLLVKEKRK